MAIPTTKSQLIYAIENRFERLSGQLGQVPDHLVLDKSMEGHAKGSQMSVHDLVSYLAGWNELVLKWLERDDAGMAVDFPETGFQWNELGQLAAKFYEDGRKFEYKENRQRLEVLKRTICENCAGRTCDELYGRPWYRKYTKGRMIQLNTASPYENARIRLRKWLKAQAG